MQRSGSDRWEATEVYPVDFISQGVIVPAGDWRVRFRYWPRWLTWTLAVAGIGWLVCSALTVNLIKSGFGRRFQIQ